MNRLVWIITVPIAIVVVLFAVVNRAPVALSLWPLPWEIEAPVFLFTLGAIVFGFLFGAVVAWVSGGATRHKLRTTQRELAEAQEMIGKLKRQQEQAAALPSAATRSTTALPPAA